jgi:CheY-like chemotaxis protein
LAISQYLVHGHDGKIWAESDGKGRGARFTFEIPVLPNSSVSPPATIPEAAVQHLSGKRVLLVDDAPDILDLLSFWLKKYSIEVTTAGSVREAFATLESQRPDMVFCDIGMPAEDGYAFISRLRGHSDPELRTLPVAALTAYTEESERLRALASGFSRHLIKPVTLTRLISVMNEIFPAKATHEAPEKFN